jgi:hypothetical protein
MVRRGFKAQKQLKPRVPVDPPVQHCDRLGHGGKFVLCAVNCQVLEGGWVGGKQVQVKKKKQGPGPGARRLPPPAPCF